MQLAISPRYFMTAVFLMSIACPRIHRTGSEVSLAHRRNHQVSRATRERRTIRTRPSTRRMDRGRGRSSASAWTTNPSTISDLCVMINPSKLKIHSSVYAPFSCLVWDNREDDKYSAILMKGRNVFISYSPAVGELKVAVVATSEEERGQDSWKSSPVMVHRPE